MSNDRILRTLQQDVEIPEVVRKKADQAFARIHAEQEKTEPDNRKVVLYNKKETERKAISKRKIAVVADFSPIWIRPTRLADCSSRKNARPSP